MCRVLQGKRSFGPDNRGMLSKCRLDDAEDTEDRVSTLMAWLSRKGWLHGVKFLLVQGGGTDKRCARCVAVCERSHFRGGRT